jgi:hypothetical protein
MIFLSVYSVGVAPGEALTFFLDHRACFAARDDPRHFWLVPSVAFPPGAR